ncbi:MAG: Ricin lectin [Chitinophagaceae bacterium]|nr:Ricin lectin [Chitinophagaceae bacterium]
MNISKMRQVCVGSFLLPLSKSVWVLFFLFFLSDLKAQQVNPGGGTGSYNLTLPPDDYIAGNTFDVIGGGAAGATYISKGPGYTGPFQSHQWWTSALWHTNLGDGTDGEVTFRGDNHSETMYPYPMIVTATNAGFTIQHNPNANNVSAANQVNNGPALIHMRVGFIGQNSTSTSVDGYGDYHATFRQTYGGDVIKATAASGSPYLFVSRQGTTDMNFYNQGTSVLNAIYTDANVHAISISANPGPTTGIIGIFFPPGTTLNGATVASLAGSIGSMTPGANFNADIPDAAKFVTVAVLPDASQATLTLFAQKAFNFITQTTHTYSFSEATATLTTNFSTTTNNVYGAANTGTLQALYRHQWLYSPQATGATNTGLQYPSPRGAMKLINSSSFQTVMPHLGILPNLGWANTGTKAAINAYINTFAASIGTMTTAADGYNKDQFAELTTNLQIAKQVGNNTAFNTILTQLRARLQDWLVANDADYNRYFAYSPTFNHMSHYPNGFGSSGTFVDGHFHVGYIINAAAILARYDPAFVTNYGPMVETVIRSIDNDTKDMVDPGSNGTVKPWFPYLKYFDPYAGHSWADAKATNQESVSEAIHFATGVLLWGEASSVVTGNFATRDLGALLYITETEAARQYWFDVDNVVNGAPYANAYTHQHLTMLYNWGGNYATFFGSEPEYIHGITYIPSTGASTWYGMNSPAAATEYSQIGQNYAGWDGWGQDINALQATFNATNAIAAFNTNNGLWSPDKKAFTYHWDHTFDSVGVIDPTVKADITGYQVFVKGPCKHYMIYMPPGKGPKTVTFTDGKSFNVPNDTVITYYVCPTLPLTLLSFSAKPGNQKSVNLDWTTASEVNINRFELEASTDGIHWHKIDEQPSTGIMNEAATYHYTDYNPAKGINYYRLRSVENDNTFSYSKIQAVNIGAQSGQLSIYPNPTDHVINIELTSMDQDVAYLQLLDVLGRTLISHQAVELSAGITLIPLDMSSLTPGTYILQVTTKSGALVGDYKVVKK